MALVDLLEVVEVDVAHGQQMALALAGHQCLAEQLGQARAVGQACQLVEVRLPLQPLALQPLLGDVADHQHAITHRTIGVGHREHAQVQRAGITVAAPLDHLAAPVAQAAQPGPDRTLLLPRHGVGR